MATTTWTVTKDARVADNGSDLGAGASDFNPVGTYSGYEYRTLLGFTKNFTGMVSITNADLHIRVSTQYYVAFGSDPDLYIRRLNGSWSEGSSVGLSGSNAVHWGNQPGVTGSTSGPHDVSTTESAWESFDITTIMQEALAANDFDGLRLYAASSASTDVTEFYSREQGSSDAYITITYTTNVAPSAPTVTTPADSGVPRISGTNPSIVATHVDSDGDALLDYDIDVSTDATFASITHLSASAITTGISGNNISTDYDAIRSGNVLGTEVALSRGVTYYMRIRTRSAAGVATASGYTSRDFRTNALPVPAFTLPSASGHLGKFTYEPGAGWASPRLNLAWGLTDSDSDTQTKYQVVITSSLTSGGAYSAFYDSGQVTSTAQTLVVPATFVEGSYYKLNVYVYDGYEWSTTVIDWITRARWGVALYRYDMGAAPTTIALSSLSSTTSATSAVQVEYSTNTTTTTPSTFYAAVGSAPLQRYLFYRVYLFAWGSASPTTPSLDSLAIQYSATVIVPDMWTRNDTVRIAGDPGDYVYGTQSLKITANAGNNVVASQLVPVLPNTNYVLSGRVKAQGNPDAFIAVSSGAVTGALEYTTHLVATTDWARYSIAWNSGANTSIYVVCRSGTSSSGTAYAWFDALKLEASAVVTPWSPGFVGTAVSLDAGGLQIDASAGGIFRLRGSTGGTDDRVDLGSNGLTIGSQSAKVNAAIRIAKRRLFR